MTDGVLADQGARERIRTSLDESLIVEAAAGTGKTTELIGRILAIVERGTTPDGDPLRMDGLVAVTFTRKAAGELKLRLRQELDRARAGASGRAQENLGRAIAELEEAHIGTIHSFCAELIRERPVEAGVDPGFEELADLDAPRFVEKALKQFLEERLNEPPEGLRRLFRRVSSLQPGSSLLDQLRSAGQDLLEWRDFESEWTRRDFDRTKEIDSLVKWVNALARVAWKSTNYQEPLRKSLWPVCDLQKWIRRTELETGARDYDKMEGQLLGLLKDLNKPWNQGKGEGEEFAPKLSREQVYQAREQFKALLADFQREANADLAASLRTEMQRFLSLYESFKQQAGVLDYADLLICGSRLIRENAAIRNYFQSRFSYIFVDEFQDTDPLQAEALLLLSACDPEESSWLDVQPKPGKLFIVGDPKQSIYRFRRADVSLYQQIRDALRDRGVGLVHLSCSFRSVRPIQQLVNAAFEPEMEESVDIGQPGYVPLDQFRAGLSDQPSVLVLPAPKPYSESGSVTKKAIGECLPDAVGAFVEWLVSDSGWRVQDISDPNSWIPIRPRDICLLFRQRVYGPEDITRDYTDCLEARQIPHVLVGSRSFFQREEIEAIRAALTAIEWPDDELAVYATLKGTLFGCTDSVLLGLRDKVGQLHPFRPHPKDPEAEFSRPLSILSRLAYLHKRRNERSILETITELLEFSRAHLGFVLRPAGRQVLANIQRLCDLARSFDVSGVVSFRSFVEYLENEADRQTSVDAITLDDELEGVRLMTVHGAKGLEFPVVILADLKANLSRQTPQKFVDPERRLAAFPIVGCAPWDLIDHEEIELARDREEGKRLCYVAATRARDLLVIPAVGDEVLDGSWICPLNKAIYPSDSRRRNPSSIPQGLKFGDTSVLERPVGKSQGPEKSVKPGFHRPSAGDHDVLWFDPGILRLEVRPNLGMLQEHLLANDSPGELAASIQSDSAKWETRRSAVLKLGRVPSVLLTRVTEMPMSRKPPDLAPVELVVLERPADRPSGRRFGTLVHAVFSAVGLDAQATETEQYVRLYSRLLGATEEESAAAVAAVESALQHELLEKARRAVRCEREFPISIRVGQNDILEGVIDLAFLEDTFWRVIDFKTAVPDEASRRRFEHQLQWYSHALTQITRQPSKATVLFV